MSESTRLFVIVNRAAARALEAWPRVREELARGGVAFDAHESERPGETEERTRAAISEGCATVAVVGGDGTLSAAASGYFASRDAKDEGGEPRPVNACAALAILPAGTGDDFARGLAGGKRAPLDAWLARLVAHCRNVESGCVDDESDAVVRPSVTTRRVDVLWGSADEGAHRFICLNGATLGIGAEVAGRVAAQGGTLRRLSGEARFAWAAVQSLAAWRVVPARVFVDGALWVEGELNLVAVANGAFSGGGMKFAPDASIADGLLDVVTVRGISRAGLVRELARVHRGGHLANPKVKLARGRSVRIETTDAADSLAIEADGDVRGRTPVEFRVLPGALRVVL
ncbi:MAG TPA: diacylglycerol kinase family protein [Pyrinomonadaceae bacterium]|nr:diacylglycerol kinase family protein [Pyrinomonadaceae bacterium]